VIHYVRMQFLLTGGINRYSSAVLHYCTDILCLADIDYDERTDNGSVTKKGRKILLIVEGRDVSQP